MENEQFENPFETKFIDFDDVKVGDASFDSSKIETDISQISPMGLEDILDSMTNDEEENRERANNVSVGVDIDIDCGECPSFLFSRQLLSKIILLVTPIVNGGYRLNTGRGITIVPLEDGKVRFVAYNDTNIFQYEAELDRKENTITEPVTISLNLLNRISSLLGNQILLFRTEGERDGNKIDILKIRLIGGDFILEDWQVTGDSLKNIELKGDSEELMKSITASELASTIKVFQPLFSEAIDSKYKSINFDEDSKLGTFTVNNIYMSSEIDMPSFILRPTELGLLSKVALINDLKNSDIKFYKVIDSQNSGTRINIRFGESVLQAIVSFKNVDPKVIQSFQNCKEYKSQAISVEFDRIMKIVSLAGNSTITAGDIEFSYTDRGLNAKIFSRSGESNFSIESSELKDKESKLLLPESTKAANMKTKAKPLLKLLSSFRNIGDGKLLVYLSNDNMIIFNGQFTALFFPRIAMR